MQHNVLSKTKPHLLPYTNQKLSGYSGSILVECKLFKMRINLLLTAQNIIVCTKGRKSVLEETNTNTALCVPEMSTVEVVKSE